MKTAYSRRAFAGTFLITCCVFAIAPVAAQGLEFKKPDQVPPSWTQFSKLVKYRFDEWLRADDPIADRFRVYIKVHAGQWDGPPPMMTVRTWINPDGTVSKVSFSDLKDAGAASDLRTLLTRGNIGEGPPPEMLQPIHLRFSLDLR
jgi:hypothetical protein